MNAISFLGLAGATLLAFANGANDISKPIATLVGSGESSYPKAVVIVSFATAAGAILASAWAVKMTLLFTHGILSSQVRVNELFSLSIIAGSIAWVLLSTRLGLPVSTTHAIVGSVILTAIYAFGLRGVLWGSVTRMIVFPLLLSPVAAFFLTWIAFRFLFWLCRKKYCLNCHWAHWMSAASAGFARGLNDAPKIAAMGLVFYSMIDPSLKIAPRWFFLILAAAMFTGGVVMGLRVTETLAHKVTRVDHLEGFAANLATSLLVAGGALYGWPMSTTHVASGGIIGIGLTKKEGSKLNSRLVGEIILAWLITLPIAGILSVAAYWTLARFVLPFVK